MLLARLHGVGALGAWSEGRGTQSFCFLPQRNTEERRVLVFRTDIDKTIYVKLEETYQGNYGYMDVVSKSGYDANIDGLYIPPEIAGSFIIITNDYNSLMRFRIYNDKIKVNPIRFYFNIKLNDFNGAKTFYPLNDPPPSWKT